MHVEFSLRYIFGTGWNWKADMVELDHVSTSTHNICVGSVDHLLTHSWASNFFLKEKQWRMLHYLTIKY